MINFTESDFAEVYKESGHFRKTTSKALFNDFEFIRNRLANLPDGQDETLELNQVVDIFINSGAKFQSKKDFKEINRFLQALLNSILINRISVTHRNLTPLQAADFTFNSYHNFFIQDRAAKK